MKREQIPQAAGSFSSPESLPTEAEVRTADLEAQEEELREAHLMPDPTDEGSRTVSEREQAIRQAAYEAYVRRGGAPGGEMDDWLEAERNVGGRGD